MEFYVATAIGLLCAAGLRLICEGRSFPVILGTTFLSHAINLFLFASGRLVANRPPVVPDTLRAMTDPLPQALVLTAIVISFGMSAVVAAIAVAARIRSGSDRLEGEDGDPGPDGVASQKTARAEVASVRVERATVAQGNREPGNAAPGNLARGNAAPGNMEPGGAE